MKEAAAAGPPDPPAPSGLTYTAIAATPAATPAAPLQRERALWPPPESAPAPSTARPGAGA